MSLSTNTIYLLSVLLVGGGAGLLYLILRRRPSRGPQGIFEWASVTFSLLIILAAVGLSVVAFTTTPDSASHSVIGRPAPPLTFRLVGTGEERTLSDYRGKVVLLNLWATWCPPCLDELPQLNRLQETYGPRGLVVVTISDEQSETIERFEREQFPLKTVSGYLPQESAWPAPYSRVLSSRPFSFVIGPEGTIQNMWAGAKDYPFFEQAVGLHLPQKPSPSINEDTPNEDTP